MRKVIKIFLSILSVIILTAIIIPMVVWLLLFLPPIQYYVVKQASIYASEKLGTVVTFDKVHIKLFNAASFDGLYVEDHDRDTLLYVRKLSTGIDLPAMFRREILLRDVKLAETKLYMKQYPDNSTNLDHLIRRLKSEEEPVNIKLLAASLKVEDMEFKYRGNSVQAQEYGINFTDLEFSGINIQANDLSVVGDSISLKLSRLEFHEKSGFSVNSLSSSHIISSSNGIDLGRMHIISSGSELNIEKLVFANMRSGQLEIEAEVKDSHIDSNSLSYFLPQLRSHKTLFRNLSLNLSGPLEDISGRLSVAAGDSTSLSTTFAMQGVPFVSSTRFSIVVDSLYTNDNDIQTFISDFTGHTLKDAVSPPPPALGPVAMRGHFSGTLSDFTAEVELRTAQGNGEINLAFVPSVDHRTSFNGAIKVDNINIGVVTGIAGMGKISASSEVEGIFGHDAFSGNANVLLSHLEYGGYDYRDISMDGQIDNRRFMGRIISDDPNLNFNFDGLLDFNDSIPRYDFDMRLTNADLRRLNINKRDSVSRISFNAHVLGTGNNLDNMNGEISVKDLFYINHLDSVRTDLVTLTGTNNHDNKFIKLTSDFAEASFRSKMSYTRLAEYLTNTLYSYLPSLAETKKNDKQPIIDAPDAVENYSVINMEIKQANKVAAIFSPGLIIASGSKLSVMFNPDNERFSLTANSDYIEKGDFFISNLEINSRNQSDSLSLFIRAKEVFVSGFLLPDFSVISGARDNKINTSVRFNNLESGQSALLGTNVSLSKNSISGLPQAYIRITPSHYTLADQQWNIFTRGIIVDAEKIVINDFGINGSGQQLRVSGVASPNISDTLRIDVHNFDINPLSSILNIGYRFYGRASGEAYILAALKNPILNASIDLDDMAVDEVAVPPLQFLSTWEHEYSQARFILIKKNETNPLLIATYHPSTKRINGIIDIPNIDLSLLDTHYEGTLSRTKGSAAVHASIGGFGRQIKLNGTVNIHEYTSLVDFLNVSYSAAPGTLVNINNNVLLASDIILTDPEGNNGRMEMSIDLNKLNNVKHSFNISSEDMLLLNTTKENNELFYGKVYGTGNANIRGSKQGVSLDITASTSDNSRFYMPLSYKSDMSDADFVTFIEPRQRQVADTMEYNIRKRMIMNRERVSKRIESSGNINTNIALTVQPNTYVELLIDPQTGHTVRARGNGLLNLHINPRNSEFTMYGDYQINEGTYLFTLENIIEKPFAIEQGSNIQWTGDPVDALLNISGVYRLKTSISAAMTNAGYDSGRMRIPVECRIMLTDRLYMPSLTFNITAPGATPETQNILSSFLNTQEMMATQFFFLLATGNFYDYEGNAGNIGAAAGSTTAFDFLSNQFSNWMSSDRFNIGIRYRPQTEMTSDEWGIGVSQQLLGDRLLLEIEGNYDTRNNTEAQYTENMKNFTGDFYLTGLLDKFGSLKAKIFTRTINRFDENQGLQESGMGLYYTEDFNTFGDIIRNLKERFTGERRRKRMIRERLEENAEATEKAIRQGMEQMDEESESSGQN